MLTAMAADGKRLAAYELGDGPFGFLGLLQMLASICDFVLATQMRKQLMKASNVWQRFARQNLDCLLELEIK